jgi:hypothetical protein
MLKTTTSIINASQIKTPITFAGDVTLSTGNLVIGTAGKGIDFSVTSGAGTSELFSDYEEGVWTPADNSGAGLTFTGINASYTKIGRAVTINVELTFPVTVNATAAAISLPFSSDSGTRGGGAIFSNRAGGTNIYFVGGANFVLYSDAGGALTNVDLSTKYLIFSLTYFTT